MNGTGNGRGGDGIPLRLSTGRARALWRLALGALVSAGCLWLAVRRVDWPAVLAEAGGLHAGWLIAALASVGLAIWCRAARWRWLFGRRRWRHGLGQWLAAVVVGQGINALVPLRFGEVARALVIAREERVGRAEALWTMVLEKLLDALTLLVALAVLAPAVPVVAWLRPAALVLTAACLAAIGVIATLVVWRELVARLVHWEAESAFGRRLRLSRWVEVVSRGAGLALLDGLGWRWAIWSGLLFLVSAATNGLVALSLGLGVPATAAALLLVVLQMSAVIPLPTAPGRLGVFHYLCLLTLGLYGLTREQALAYSLVLHAVTYLPIALGGAVGVWALGPIRASGDSAD